MKVHLLYPDRALDPDGPVAAHAADLVADLELGSLLDAMAGGDAFLRETARRVLVAPVTDPAGIHYRQAILADARERRAVVRDLYGIAVDAVLGEARVWGAFLDAYAESVLARATTVLELFIGLLRRLRSLGDQHAATFASDGMRRLFAEIDRDLDDAYLRSIEVHLEHLRFRDGMVLSVGLGAGNRGDGYVLRRPADGGKGWRQRVPLLDRDGYTYRIPEQSETAARNFAALKSQGIAQAAAALAQATDQILGYFKALRFELGFYVGCLNLEERLTAKRQSVCVPVAQASGSGHLSVTGLRDLALVLAVPPGGAVANDLDAAGRPLVVITGANRGGKSTLLRSLGQAQLMLQAGMFVGAEAFEAEVRGGVYTHFKREEDAGLESGKLDEELRRMSRIVDALPPDALLLLNESFASTNEREGAEIARQIVRPLLDAGVRVTYVTHMFALADGLARSEPDRGLFLRAERTGDGGRTYRVVPGEPLPTSYGGDIYRRVFGRPLGD